MYFITVGVLEYVRVKYYATDEMRAVREEKIAEEFQDYVHANKISSTDTEAIRQFVVQETYIHIMLYKDDEVYFASGIYDDANFIPLISNLLLGGSVDYPTEEEAMEYIGQNNLVTIDMKDGPALASIADFSEYFYTGISKIISLGNAMLALALLKIIYFFSVVNRMMRLATDVNAVADGDMERKIHDDGNDEIAKLSHDIENMRNTLVQTLESEREARMANSELVTSMSHDIRTPLTVLIGYLDIMKMYSKDEIMNEYIKNSEKTAMRLKKLSDDMFKYLLVFGDSAKPCELEEYDGETLLEQLLTEHVLLLKENGYDVRFIVPDKIDATVLTDAPELMRVIDNIFSNIRKYADKRSPVCVTVSLNDGRVLMEFSNYISKDTAAVESTGIGLKTCAKISELISCDFSYIKDADRFSAYIGLISQRSQKE